MKLYLIRHAESANNVLYADTGSLEGRLPDPEITETGHRQAELLSGHLAAPEAAPRRRHDEPSGSTEYALTHLYCSLMTRSILTAEYIGKACGLRVKALADVFERKGIYEFDENGNEIGLPGPGLEYFNSRFPHVALPDGVSESGWWDRPVETDEEFLLRVANSLKSLFARHGDSDHRVGLVAHGDFIDQCVNEIMGVGRKQENYRSVWEANWVLHNTSVSRVDVVSGSTTVVYLNRIDHLDSELVTW